MNQRHQKMISKSKTIVLGILVLALFSFKPEAKGHHYKIILFEGSDWCLNCIRLERNVLTDDIFIRFMAYKDISLERIDFPQRKAQSVSTKAYNSEMAEKYNFQGVFPTILLIETSTGEQTKLEYVGQNSIDFIEQIKTHLIH
tara:strand:+ start:22 stop:450 length:429 start_codon:yes stop_codon:yes gene_type:complete